MNTPTADENLFEIKLSVAQFARPLRIYTRAKTFALGADLWSWLRVNVVDQTIEVSVRGLTVASDNTTVTLAPSPAAQASFTIAPIEAPGKIVYWSIKNNNGVLKGFGVGEEGVREVLRADQVQTRDPSKQCVGCHAATPDGENVGFAMGTADYFDFMADIRQTTVGAKPTYATDAAIAAIAQLHGIPAYSRAHWSDGDRIVLLSNTGDDLHWVRSTATNKASSRETVTPEKSPSRPSATTARPSSMFPAKAASSMGAALMDRWTCIRCPTPIDWAVRPRP